MQNIFLFVRYYLLGMVIAAVAFMFLVLVTDAAFAAEPTQRVQEATIGQQDRTVSVDRDEYEGYDNSGFLRDMDAIARGTYIDPDRYAAEETLEEVKEE